ILLELESSLKLFGGLPPILEQVRSGLSALGLTGVAASAPTAMGARCLAIAGRDWHVRHTAGMAQAIGPLPVSRLAAALGLDEQALAMLHAIGVRTIAEMDALPRSGFARRFGPGLLKKLDSAFGRCAEAHDFFVLPQRFTSRLELAYGTEAAEALLFAANRLFVQLEAFLRARAGAAERIVLHLEHENFPATEMSIEFVEPGRSARHFAALARERLSRIVLPAPVRSLLLEAPAMQPFAAHEESLFPDAGCIPQEWQRLLERLQARLGVQAVHGIAVAEDYRPERAGLDVNISGERGRARSAASSAGQTIIAKQAKTAAQAITSAQAKTAAQAITSAQAVRPLWLLREPLAIIESNGRLQLEQSSERQPRGKVTLLAGPERIESGWWDGGDIARDYFIAQSEDSALLWVYCQRGAQARWYLHGIFS
ncbi:MAG TPA: DNA polymerase Y family protein, partial [Steroidobacteraceae bacterium]|nr:DNA polymerase Y family protein [Steroidobacteraceae bacterium]